MEWSARIGLPLGAGLFCRGRRLVLFRHPSSFVFALDFWAGSFRQPKKREAEHWNWSMAELIRRTEIDVRENPSNPVVYLYINMKLRRPSSAALLTINPTNNGTINVFFLSLLCINKRCVVLAYCLWFFSTSHARSIRNSARCNWMKRKWNLPIERGNLLAGRSGRMSRRIRGERGLLPSRAMSMVSVMSCPLAPVFCCQVFPLGLKEQQRSPVEGRREKEKEKKNSCSLLLCSLQKVIARRSLMSWVTDCRVGGGYTGPCGGGGRLVCHSYG